jgi:hypothetical protein
MREFEFITEHTHCSVSEKIGASRDYFEAGLDIYNLARPLHKFACSDADSSLNLMKISETLEASDFLNMNLQSCFVIAFDILHRPRLGLDKPVVARLYMGVEPTDILKFYDIYTGSLTVPPVPGMVQLNAFTPLPDTVKQEGWMVSWRAARKSNEFPRAPVGLLLVSKANTLVCVLSLTITQSVLDLVRRDGGFTEVSALTGEVKQYLYSVVSFMQYVAPLVATTIYSPAYIGT